MLKSCFLSGTFSKCPVLRMSLMTGIDTIMWIQLLIAFVIMSRLEEAQYGNTRSGCI